MIRNRIAISSAKMPIPPITTRLSHNSNVDWTLSDFSVVGVG